jgi:hypothetical protein
VYFLQYRQLSQKLPGRRIIWPTIRIILTGGKICPLLPQSILLFINSFKINIEYSHVYAVCSMDQLYICSNFLYMTITLMITHVTCSFNDRIFKLNQECRLKRQYTCFPGKIDRTMTKGVKLKKVTKRIWSWHYANAQKMYKSDTNTATQSGVTKLFMPIGVMENWLTGW